jgi:hypothetical protein
VLHLVCEFRESRMGGGAGDGFAIIFYRREGDGDGYRLPPV